MLPLSHLLLSRQLQQHPRWVQLRYFVFIRYIHPTPSQIFYPYRIVLEDIDPKRIAGRIAGGAGGYPWRVVPAVPRGGAFPPGYKEAETVLTEGTTAALLTAIVGNFRPRRNRMVRQIYGQTAAFGHIRQHFPPNLAPE